MLSTDEITSWLDERVNKLIKYPQMWGPNLAVELQLLQCVEFRKLITDGEALKAEPRLIVNAWVKFNRDPVVQVDQLSDDEFVERLKKLTETLKSI